MKRKTQKNQEDQDKQPSTQKGGNSKRLKGQQTIELEKSQVATNHSSELGDGIFSSITDSDGTIKISTWNVNGIRACMKKQDFNKYFQDYDPDIICFNETKIDGQNFIKENILESIPSGYFSFWNFSVQKGYAGTAILSKVAPINVVYDIGVGKHGQEGRTITLEYDRFYLVACYVPNAGHDLNRLDYRTKEWDADFQVYLQKLKETKPTILCGDLNVAHQNIDIYNPTKQALQYAGFTLAERKNFTEFLQNGWVDTFRHFYPTQKKFSYWSIKTGARAKDRGWRLDYFIINKEFLNSIKSSTINNTVYGSDHCPLECVLLINQL